MKDAQAEPAADITADAVVTDPPATPPPVPPVPPVPPKATDPPPSSSTPPPALTTAAGPSSTPEIGNEIDPVAIKTAAEAEAAGALAAVLKGQAGIVPELVTGATIADVQASYAAAQKAYGEIKAQVLADLGAAIPGGRASGGGGPVPNTPYDMILTGITAAGNK